MKTNLKNQLRKVVNASGRMTKLGVSTQSDFMLEQMQYASNQYFVMDELYEKAGQIIAEMLSVKAAFVSNSASSGIVLTIASLICQDDTKRINQFIKLLPQISKREVIIPKGHVVNYGVPIANMIELGGGQLIEAGCANKVTKADVECEINENTLALFYVKSHHAVQKNMVSLPDLIDLGKKYNIPVVVDAAAEEDLTKYYQLGADYVIYSGSKALCGPTSGLVLTNDETRAKYLRNQYYGIGRSMKVGKESIFGLVAAIQEYLQNPMSQKITLEQLNNFIEKVNEIDGFSATKTQDEAGREIYRAKIKIDANKLGKSAIDFNRELMSGNPAIYCRDHEANLGYLSFDPRPVKNEAELNLILDRLLEIGGLK